MRMNGSQVDQFSEFENLVTPSAKLAQATYSNPLVAQKLRNCAVNMREFVSIRQQE